MLLCLYPCSSVLYKSLTPSWGEAVPRERENQINTLVLKDINFTINIIELSYYRTIETLNQSKMAPVVYKKKADPKEAYPATGPPSSLFSFSVFPFSPFFFSLSSFHSSQ